MKISDSVKNVVVPMYTLVCKELYKIIYSVVILLRAIIFVSAIYSVCSAINTLVCHESDFKHSVLRMVLYVLVITSSGIALTLMLIASMSYSIITTTFTLFERVLTSCIVHMH